MPDVTVVICLPLADQMHDAEAHYQRGAILYQFNFTKLHVKCL